MNCLHLQRAGVVFNAVLNHFYLQQVSATVFFVHANSRCSVKGNTVILIDTTVSVGAIVGWIKGRYSKLKRVLCTK